MGGASKNKEREETIRRLVEEFERDLRKQIESDPTTLHEIEEAAEKLGETTKRKFEQKVLESAGTGYAGPRTLCPCGRQARYVGDRSRTLLTRSGSVQIRRSYYHCAKCHWGDCPQDRVWDLPRCEYTDGVAALAARLCSYLPFRQAVRELEYHHGLSLSVSTLERLSRRLGEAIEQEWDKRQQKLWTEPDALSSPVSAKQLHVSMDGVMIHVGKEWREVKLGVAFQAERDRGALCHDFYATLQKSTAFGKRVRTLAHLCGADKCGKVALLADGGKWIWQEGGKYFSDKVQILDYYHALQHLWEVAYSRYGERSVQATQWMALQSTRLQADEIDKVIADVSGWHPRNADKQQVRTTNLEYLRTHRSRMRYKAFTDAGWHIGSGVQEASCNWVVQERLKLPGMRWSEKGAEAMLHMRAAWCSDHAPDFRTWAHTANRLPHS